MPGVVPSLPPDAQRYIAGLEARLEQAEKALRLLPQQKGPLPGWLRLGTIEAATIVTSVLQASLIQGPQPVSGPFATFDLTGNVPGVSPLLRINDGTRDRVQIGNLAAYTDPFGIISPAGYGARVVDSSGNLVWDTTGQGSPGIMKLLGSSNTGATSVSGTGFTAVGGSTVTFTLSRVASILVLFLGVGSITTEGGGNVGFLRSNLDSGATTSGNLNFGTAQALTLTGPMWTPTLSASTHTVNLDMAVNQTPNTFNIIQTATLVFQLGG